MEDKFDSNLTNQQVPEDNYSNSNKQNFLKKKWIIVFSLSILSIIGIIVFIFFKFDSNSNTYIESENGKHKIVENVLNPEFDTPEKTIEKLEKELNNNGNFELYSERTYFSESLKTSLKDDLYLTVDEFNETWEHILKYYHAGDFDRKIDAVAFSEKRIIDDQHIFLSYVKKFNDDNSESDSAYLVRKEDGWYIDFEPEYLDLKNDPEEWNSFRESYENTTNQIVYKEDSHYPGLSNKLYGEWVVDIIKKHEIEVAKCFGQEFYSSVMCEKKLNNDGYAMGYDGDCVTENNKRAKLCYNNLFNEKSKDIFFDEDEEYSSIFLSLSLSNAKDSGYTRKIINDVGQNRDKNDFFSIIKNDRIRFYGREFIPYDLVFDNGNWKIDAEVSVKYIKHIEEIEKIEEMPQKNIMLAEHSLLGVVDALDSYKSEYGYFPKKLIDLFPEYYYNYASYLELSEFNEFKYSYYPENNPQKIHIGSYDYEYDKKDEILTQYDSDFNSENVYVNGFNGDDNTIIKSVRNGEVFTEERSGLFDLTSDDFGKFREYFNTLFNDSSIE
ncbi:MAG: hypothetical protein ACD_11C00017G0032 [uncultured bacterium]|nr:MAG: hypothetical protein ACD_11C00017G0032 [uncultured bacterium]HBR71518.1 hypothetical protein [Candidatus Moranbacteria bacterium]